MCIELLNTIRIAERCKFGYSELIFGWAYVLQKQCEPFASALKDELEMTFCDGKSIAEYRVL